jgi:MSHA biogenesis protein MshJ
MSLNKQLIKLQFKIDHTSLQQRIAILCGVLLTIYISWFYLIYSPQIRSIDLMRQEITDISNQTDTIQRKIKNILLLDKRHDVKEQIAKYQRLRQRMEELNQRIVHFHHSYIDDKELAKLLDGILNNIQSLTIEHFLTVENHEKAINKATNLPPNTPLKKPQAKPASIPTPSKPARKANVELSPSMMHYMLQLKGDYFSIMKFLQHVEKLKWQLFWDKFDYQVIRYPEAIVTIEFYTLKPARPASAAGVKQ